MDQEGHARGEKSHRRYAQEERSALGIRAQGYWRRTRSRPSSQTGFFLRVTAFLRVELKSKRVLVPSQTILMIFQRSQSLPR